MKKAILMIVLVLLSGCAGNTSNTIVGRPKQLSKDELLIGDELNSREQYIVEIPSDLEIGGLGLSRKELWRYRFEIRFKDIDTSSYPYRVVATSIKENYTVAKTMAGVVCGNGLLCTNDHSLLTYSFYEDAQFLDGLTEEDIKVGNRLVFEYDGIRESYPGQTKITKVISSEKVIIPALVDEYFEEECCFLAVKVIDGEVFSIYSIAEKELLFLRDQEVFTWEQMTEEGYLDVEDSYWSWLRFT